MNDRLFALAVARLERDAELGQLPERVAELMADLLQRVLDDLGLSEEQWAVAAEVVRRRVGELRAELEARADGGSATSVLPG